MLCVSERKVDRIKRKFVLEGLELTLNRQSATWEYNLLIDCRLKAQLLGAAKRPGALVAAAAGRPAGRARIGREHLA